MKFDFASAVNKALEGSALDEQVQERIERLIQNQKDAAARAVPEGATPKAVKPHEDEQVRAIALDAINQSGLGAVIVAALAEECVRAARSAAEPEAVKS